MKAADTLKRLFCGQFRHQDRTTTVSILKLSCSVIGPIQLSMIDFSRSPEVTPRCVGKYVHKPRKEVDVAKRVATRAA